MACPDAGQRLEAVSTARTGRNFSISNRSTVSTSTPTACRSRYQSLTASCLIYDHVSFKPQHRPCHPLYSAMILLHNVVEILDLTDFDRGAVLGIVALDRRFVGRTPVDGHL